MFHAEFQRVLFQRISMTRFTMLPVLRRKKNFITTWVGEHFYAADDVMHMIQGFSIVWVPWVSGDYHISPLKMSLPNILLSNTFALQQRRENINKSF